MSDELRKWSPGEAHPLTLPGGEVMVLRYIPAGRFRMGQRGGYADEEPVHWVEVEDFWLGEAPVTQAQFAEWTQAEGIKHTNEFAGNPDHPAESMDWHQAVAFCEWLRAVVGGTLPAEHVWPQLPNEAQWEYACRAGTETEYWSGDGEPALAAVGWFDANANNTTQPVRKKSANPGGLYEMHGNVWEWCADVWDAAAYGRRADGWQAAAWTADDAELSASGGSPNRVLRGGSWVNAARLCRAAFRDGRRPSYRFGDNGFRVCLARSRPPVESRTGEAEPRPGGEPRRDDEVEPDGRGSAGGAGLDLARERLPRG